MSTASLTPSNLPQNLHPRRFPRRPGHILLGLHIPGSAGESNQRITCRDGPPWAFLPLSCRDHPLIRATTQDFDNSIIRRSLTLGILPKGRISRIVVPTPNFSKRLRVLPLYPRLPARLLLKLRRGLLQHRASGGDHHDCLRDLEY
jgi:hypothetical protein